MNIFGILLLLAIYLGSKKLVEMLKEKQEAEQGDEGGENNKGVSWDMPKFSFGKNGLRVVKLLIFLLLVVFLASKSFFIIPSGSQGVVFRLGKVNSVADQGPHFKIPLVDVVEIVNTENIRRFEYGYRTVQVGPPARYRDVPSESKMLTQDNKIVEIDWVLQYQISDPIDYVTHIPEDRVLREKMIRDIAESFMRQVVGARALDDVLTKEKQAIQTEVRIGLQQKMDMLSMGTAVSAISLQDVVPPKAVQQSFSAVNSARAEKERLILEAEKYSNEIYSEAVGESERLLNEATAYAFRRITLAEGEAARLKALSQAYRSDPELMKLNLWMETMTDVWDKMNPVFVEGDGSIKLLPLDKLISSNGDDIEGKNK